MVDFNKKLKEYQDVKAQGKLKAQMDAATATAAPSLNPPDRPEAPPKKEEEVVPDIRELISSPVDRIKMFKLVAQSVALSAQEREAKKAKKPITATLKKILGHYGIGRAMCNEYRVVYYNAPRATISKELLLGEGISPALIAKCTVSKDAYTLRIIAPGMDTDDDE